MPSVLLTNAQLRKTLAAVRSLGRKGISSVILEETHCSPTAFSKFCTTSLICPNPNRNPEAYYRSLVDTLRKFPCDIIYPMDDTVADIVADHRDELRHYCHIPLPSSESYYIARDKGKTYVHTEEAGVLQPKTVYPSGSDDVAELCAYLTYPLLIKPVKSSGGRGITRVYTSNELQSKYLEVHGQYPFPIVQEDLGPGEIFEVVLLYNQQSQLRASFIQKHVRKYPLTTGPSCVQESVEFPEVLGIALQLMSGLNWYGIVGLEFLVQKQTGKIFFIEINPRFVNSLQMALFAGIDFPWLLYQIATEGDCETINNYQTGIRCRNLLPSDILHFLTNPNRWHMDPPFFSGKRNNVFDDIISTDDPLPTLGFIAACLRYLFDASMWRFLLRR